MFSGKLSIIVSAVIFMTTSSGFLQAETEAVINVTATRTVQTVDESLSSVSVITRDDIERRQPRDVVELLKTQAGIDIVRSGGAGGNTSVFLRGGNSDHVLVLIDGVRVSSATTGVFAWSQLPINQVERIEIVRGNRTAQYGSDAISGVIQIFTRRAKGVSGSLTGGSYGYRGFSVNAGGSQDGFAYSASAGYEANDGFSATNKKIGSSYDPDKDSYSNKNVNLHVSTELETINQSIDFSFFRTDADTDFDQGKLDSVNQSANLTLQGNVNENWYQKLVAGWANDDLKTTSAFPSDVETNRFMLDWQNDFFITEDSILTFGLNHVQDDGKNIDQFLNATVYDDRVTTDSAYLQLQSEFDRLDTLLAFRYDDHDNFGDKTTGQVALGLQATDALRLVASYGTAFKAPDLNELFHPGYGGWYAGNPALQPEESETVELSLRYRLFASQSFSLSFYKTDVDDLIAYEGALNQAINIHKAEMQGVEVIYDGEHGPWHWSMNATYQETEDKTTGQDLLRRPEKKLAFDLSYQFLQKHYLGVELFTSSKSRDVGGDNASYNLVNVFGRYQFNEHYALSARIENLFDEDYEVARGYNTAGLSGFLTLTYQ